MSDYRNIIQIDVDTKREPAILIGKTKEFQIPTNAVEHRDSIVKDITTLCDALCLLINTASDNKLQTEADSIRTCVAHIKEGLNR